METESKLYQLFEDELKDIYWAETHLVKALPKMAEAATSEQLKKAFEKHLEVTQKQVSRLEEVFSVLGKKASAKKCEAMSGLIEEANTIIGDTEKDTMTRDCGLIFAAQKVEHYEIATYGCLKAVANILGEKEAAELLNQTLQEEKNTDVELTVIAESFVNQEAEKE